LSILLSFLFENQRLWEFNPSLILNTPQSWLRDRFYWVGDSHFAFLGGVLELLVVTYVAYFVPTISIEYRENLS